MERLNLLSLPKIIFSLLIYCSILWYLNTSLSRGGVRGEFLHKVAIWRLTPSLTPSACRPPPSRTQRCRRRMRRSTRNQLKLLVSGGKAMLRNLSQMNLTCPASPWRRRWPSSTALLRLQTSPVKGPMGTPASAGPTPAFRPSLSLKEKCSRYTHFTQRN